MAGFDPYRDSFIYTTFIGYKGADAREEKADWTNLMHQFKNPVECLIADEYQHSPDSIYARKKFIASNELRYMSGASYKTLTDWDWLKKQNNWTFRIKENLDTIYLLTMDFDDESNKRRIPDMFRDMKIKSIIYPSAGNGYSKFSVSMAEKHDELVKKTGRGKNFDRRLIGKTIYKYRAIVPLAVPIDAGDWDMQSIKWHAPSVFGAIDTSCFNKAHSQGMPVSCFYDPIAYNKSIRIFDHGCEFYDISDWPKKPAQTRTTSSSGQTYTSSGNGINKTETFHHDRLLERPDGSIFTYDDMLDGTEESIICPFENHKGRTQTAKIWRHQNGGAQIFCQKTNCVANTTIRMTPPKDISLFTEPTTDLDFNKVRKKPEVVRGYDKSDLYNGLSLADGTLVSSMTHKQISNAFNKMKFTESVYFDIKRIVERNERNAAKERKNIKPLFIFDDFDDNDVRWPKRISPEDRLIPKRNKALKTMIEKTMLNINYDTGGRYLLVDEEGSGKSTFALYMASALKQKVGFYCASWKQAYEQYTSFSKYCTEHKIGIDVMLYKSRAEIIKCKYPGFEVSSRKKAPFESSVMHEQDYIDALAEFMTKKQAVEAYNVCANEYAEQKNVISLNKRLRKEGIDRGLLLISTHAMLDGISKSISDQRQKNKEIEKANEEDGENRKTVDLRFVNPFNDFIVWVDDIRREQFENYVERKKDDAEYDGEYKVVEDSLGVSYFERREDQVFAVNIGDGRPVIFTTTEMLAGEMVKRAYSQKMFTIVSSDGSEMELTESDIKVPDLLGDTRLHVGRGYLMGTDMVGSKYDGILPMIVNEINDDLEKHYTLIGNGIGAENNLSNTKGQNAFIDSNLIIKVSEPHTNVLRKYSDLEFSDLDQDVVRVALVLDDLHQAVGRAGGNRYADGTHMIILVPVGLLEKIEAHSRYKYSSVEVLTGEHAPVFDMQKQKDVQDVVDCLRKIDSIAFGSRFDKRVTGYVKGIDNAGRRKQFCSRLARFYEMRVQDFEKSAKKLGNSYKDGRQLKKIEGRIRVGKSMIKHLKVAGK